MVKAFQKSLLLVPSPVPTGFLRRTDQHFFEIVVDQLDTEQVVHACDSHLNIVDLEECADHEGDLTSSDDLEMFCS